MKWRLVLVKTFWLTVNISLSNCISTRSQSHRRIPVSSTHESQISQKIGGMLEVPAAVVMAGRQLALDVLVGCRFGGAGSECLVGCGVMELGGTAFSWLSIIETIIMWL
eukprot:Protomagalhaensia_wolfi_Nauph_80__6125@NODE_884_length_1913_cov_123_763074_g664_i0_p3_GENE_NODE_884_length_1913_cov_123_763074_g664_i0NODE_884_length_1913_cov_123_763074_g664_i0_p3_ORF_typecomplete_len109_score14_18DSPc/PF00782_20/0_083PEPutilizers_C/PF02896_18/0_19_NODE_884_length_1913_cov_123_763074_g664_i08271153